MASNYKKLGEFLRLTDERNSDLSITNLQGVSISKKFIPSIANIIGTDLSSYKIVRKGQFAYGPVTSRNGDKVSIALLDSGDCIISSSYLSFEVVDKTKLDPEYLMLWFMRPEFDRYARFMSNGSAREIFDWECMCGVELHVPSIEEQRKIVNDYKVISDRIELLNAVISSLENNALTYYSKFVQDKNCNCKLDEFIIENIKSKLQVGAADNTGKFPFFTSGKSILSHSEYLIDGKNLYINTGGKYDVKYYIGKAAYSTDTLSLKVIDGYEAYVYLYLMYNFKFIADSCFHGSALEHLQKDEFYNLEIYKPNKNEILEISKVLDSIFDLLLIYKSEIEALDKLKKNFLARLSKEVG